MLKFLILIYGYVRQCPGSLKINTEEIRGKEAHETSSGSALIMIMLTLCVCLYTEDGLAEMWQNVNNWRT